MNVGELKKMLDKYPDDMECVTSRYSDCMPVLESEFEVITGVPNENGGWVMMSHPTMSDENKKNEKKYLYLPGS